MNILAYHRYRPWGTGNLLVRALEREHFVWERNSEQRSPVDLRNYHWLDHLKWYKEEMKIDVVLGIGCQDIPPDDFLERIHEAGMVAAVWLMDDPMAWNGNRNQRIAKQFDIWFVAQKDLIPRYELIAQKSEHIEWLNFGADPDFWRPVGRKKEWDMYFCGASYSGHEYPKRHEWLERLIAEGHNVKATYGRFLHEYNAELNMSRIGYNHAFTDELNMRCYEVMMSGVMLLTQDIEQGFRDTFEPGKHCVTYDGDSWEDMRDKFIWYKKHDMTRRRIARAGYEHVMANYTYAHRARQMVKTIERYLKER